MALVSSRIPLQRHRAVSLLKALQTVTGGKRPEFGEALALQSVVSGRRSPPMSTSAYLSRSEGVAVVAERMRLSQLGGLARMMSGKRMMPSRLSFHPEKAVAKAQDPLRAEEAEALSSR